MATMPQSLESAPGFGVSHAAVIVSKLVPASVLQPCREWSAKDCDALIFHCSI